VAGEPPQTAETVSGLYIHGGHAGKWTAKNGERKEKLIMAASEAVGLSKVTHVIFDLDGLLMDTEELYSQVRIMGVLMCDRRPNCPSFSQAYQRALDPFGKTYTFEFKTRLIGTNEMDCATTVVQGYNLPVTPEQFLASLEREQDQLLDQAEWMPGALKLMHHLYKARIERNDCFRMSSFGEFVL
jgi:hypothetical protein